MSIDYEHLADAFARHEIRSEVRAEGFGSWLIMRRHEDGGWAWPFWARVTASDGLLTVAGDFPPVTFAHYASPGAKTCPESAVAWMGSQSGLCSYVMEKASIGTGSEAVREVCDEKAVADLRALAEDERELAEEEAQVLQSELAHLSEDERESLDAVDDSDKSYHLKRAKAFDAGAEAWVSGYSSHPWSAADVMARLERVQEVGGDTIEPCDDFRRIGEKPAKRVVLGHPAVRRLHELLSEREPERSAWERFTAGVRAWLRGGLLGLLRGEG